MASRKKITFLFFGYPVVMVMISMPAAAYHIINNVQIIDAKIRQNLKENLIYLGEIYSLKLYDIAT